MLLNTVVRLHDPCGHLSYRSYVYDGYRAQHNNLQLVTSAICAFYVLSVNLAGALVSVWPLLPALISGPHLIAGSILVIRNIGSMHFEDEEVDPCWQALVLSLTWPIWLKPALNGRTSR